MIKKLIDIGIYSIATIFPVLIIFMYNKHSFLPTRSRPNRWSLFSRMVSVRPYEKQMALQRQSKGPVNKICVIKDTMSENNESLLTVAWWVTLNSLHLLCIYFNYVSRYNEKDGCIEDFENTSDFSRQYQAQQNCLCDSEHMFNCPTEENSQKHDQVRPLNIELWLNSNKKGSAYNILLNSLTF